MKHSTKRMMRVLGLVLLLALAAGSLGAQAWEGHYQSGDITAGVGAGFYFFGSYLSVFPFAEWTMADLSIGDVFPLALGVSAKGIIGINPSGVVFGGGPFVTAHVGLKGLDIPEFLQALDWYLALGLTFDTSQGLKFSSYGGISYFFGDGIAVYAETNYLAFYRSETLGILVKL